MALCINYGPPIQSRDIIGLQYRVTEATTTAIADVLAKTWQGLDHRMDIVYANDGAHVKRYK